MQLSREFFQEEDVVAIAQALLGKRLMTRIGGCLTGGIIVETEAYGGVTDKASHAYGGRRTKRTEVLYAMGGIAYVYLCYGVHALFNIVTHKEGTPHGVLIRAIKPTHGVDIIRERRGGRAATSGPGCVTQALGIMVEHSGTPLDGDLIWVEAGDASPATIKAEQRIGIDYAREDAKRLWRFLWVPEENG